MLILLYSRLQPGDGTRGPCGARAGLRKFGGAVPCDWVDCAFSVVGDAGMMQM